MVHTHSDSRAAEEQSATDHSMFIEQRLGIGIPGMSCPPWSP